MDRVCYSLTIRQRRCINGVATSIDNIYTNVAVNSIIPLSFGYFLTFISNNTNSATIQISNTNQVPNMIFNIPSGNYKIFDLPTSSGNVRVFVGATAINCGDTIVCSRM